MKNLLESKQFIIILTLFFLTLFIYIYSQKDFITVSTGDMVRPRAAHNSILMHDGRVFIIGGEYLSTEGASAEIYDPKTGKFTFIGNINERIGYKPILLPNNQILLVGFEKNTGENGIPYSEIYDPISHKFINVSKLHYPKIKTSIFLLPNGKVLIPGGVTIRKFGICDARYKKNKSCYTDLKYNQAELYDYKTGKFTLTDKMLHPGSGTSIQLDNGNVLTYGAVLHKKIATIEAEIYNYKENKFIRTKNDLGTSCYLEAIALKNGKALFTDSNKHIAEIYDSKTNSFHQIKYMNITRLFPEMILLNDGKVLIMGGYPKNVGDDPIIQAEIFDPSTETFTLTGEMNRFGFLNSEPREGYITTLLPSGKVLIAGGFVGKYNYTRATDAVEIYYPQTGKFAKFKMRAKRRYFTQTLLKDSHVLIVGGDDDNGHLNSAEIFTDK